MPDDTYLGEAFLQGSSVFATGMEELSLGTIFVPGAAEDLSFRFGTNDGVLLDGRVEYVSIPAADFNGDGVVNIQDFLILQIDFGMAGATRADGDANGDGLVTILDFLILQVEFGSFVVTSTAIPAAERVPEPTTLCLTWLALATFFSSRKFWRRAVTQLLGKRS